MRTLIALLLLTLHAHAAKVTLAWDYPGDVAEDGIAYYVLWQRVGDAWRIVKSANVQEATVDLPNGDYVFVVTAVDRWGYSSEYSDPLIRRVRGNKIR